MQFISERKLFFNFHFFLTIQLKLLLVFVFLTIHLVFLIFFVKLLFHFCFFHRLDRSINIFISWLVSFALIVLFRKILLWNFSILPPQQKKILISTFRWISLAVVLLNWRKWRVYLYFLFHWRFNLNHVMHDFFSSNSFKLFPFWLHNTASSFFWRKLAFGYFLNINIWIRHYIFFSLPQSHRLFF